MDVLVVTPTYNERDNLPLLAAGVLKHPGFRLLVVDDGSPDGTGAIADQLAREHPGRIEVLHRTGARGLGRSYVDGLLHAIAEGRADFICQMDCDLSHGPEYLPDLVAAAASHEIVLGSRYLNGVSVVNWPLQRLLLSYFASIYARRVTGLPIRDTTGGYKCFRRRALEGIDLSKVKSDGYGFQIEMTYRCWKKGFTIREIPILFVDRLAGVSKMSRKIVYEAAFMVWRLRWLSLIGRLE